MNLGLGFQEAKPDFQTSSKLKEGAYGMPDKMVYGLGKVHDKVTASHPLEESERNYAAMQDATQMTVLRNTQGLHAPLRLTMERRAAQQVGRLPFLPSSNLQLEVLRGDDVTLDFNDVLNTPDFKESLYMPHAVIERNLGLL
uniref:Proteasome maturation protein n=1 Tax=Graphocephala atropunctata TaxID=36148 RepID=A0A1B6KIQ1_9HEMI